MSLNLTSDGSPTPRKGRFAVAEDLRIDTSGETLGMAGVKRPNSASHDVSIPLMPSTRGNQAMMAQQQQPPLMKTSNRIAVDGYKKLKVNQDVRGDHPSASLVDSLLQRLSDQPSPPGQHHDGKKMGPADAVAVGRNIKYENSNSSNGSIPITPATDEFAHTPVTEPDTKAMLIDAIELQKLKNELVEARNEVARMNQELHTTHLTKSTLDHAIGQSSDLDFNHYKGGITEQDISQLQNKFNESTRQNYGRQESWQFREASPFEKGDNRPFGNGQGIWGNATKQPAPFNNPPPNQHYSPTLNMWTDGVSRPHSTPFYGSNGNVNAGMDNQGLGPIQPQPRIPTAQPGFRGRNAYLNEPMHFPLDQGFRGHSTTPSRPGSAFDNPRYNQFSGNMTPNGRSMPMPPPGAYGPPGGMNPYQPRPFGPIGTRLSPEAAEFSVDAMVPSPWNSQVKSFSSIHEGMANLNMHHQPPSESGGVQYAAPVEPMNYRRLLDRNMNCNWKYIVDKINCNNDQQASIFLQQKLKVGTAEQKFEIIEAIISQAYPLMINRFGNFLVQRCFEHGTPEQVIAIAGAIRGNVLTLSMDAFGCHVIQKAFDAVPEEYKAAMVHELLLRIPETVIHRYACHVWQKLFELRWVESPPKIMKHVNEALRGMWHEVALGETGSLVVQNIFENCLEDDKRPCIEEVLASIDVIAHGQFGNWCIQHICEHGAPVDRSRAVEHIIRFATEYSMDQYASKVIEKCLKIGGNEFLDRYLDRVCEGRADRPRMPLIDIAGDQFGNYLIQYILTNSGAHHREIVASHVRKHMVSLRGSKYGSRVAMLCCNPALATRPGPPAGMQINRYTSSNLHRGGAYNGFR